jgi:sporulation protein YlmC with PRC-barrel domain
MDNESRNQDNRYNDRHRENMNQDNSYEDDRYRDAKKDIESDASRNQSYRDLDKTKRESGNKDFSKQDNRTLYYLDELSGYKVASDYEDVRGWEVVDKSNRTIGEVDDLLVNKNTERVVYLDVEIDDKIAEQVGRANDRPVTEGTHSYINEEGENHLIIPVGTIDIDDDNKKVYARDIEFAKFLQAKWIKKGSHIDRDYEMKTLRTYYPESSWDETERDDERFYDRREFRHGNRF